MDDKMFKAQVKAKLALMGKPQYWLVEEVKRRSGDTAGTVDHGVISNVVNGKMSKRSKKGAYIKYLICEILDIKEK